MSKDKFNVHYVATIDEADRLVKRRRRFWISNCGCRESVKKPCRRSRVDVCLYFTDTFGSSGTGFKRASAAAAKKIIKEAREKFLVARPFRDPKNKNVPAGICFCCDCCCGYFKTDKYRCDKGMYVEKTDFETCTACGSCVDVCYFNARSVKKGGLKIDRRRCYGCGLCVEACRREAVSMVKAGF